MSILFEKVKVPAITAVVISLFPAFGATLGLGSCAFGTSGLGLLNASTHPSLGTLRMRAVLPPVDAVSTLTLPTAARAFSLGFSLELRSTNTSRCASSCFLVETNASRDHLRK